MPELFNASDVLETAIRIEENGEVFYRQAAKKIKTDPVQKIFEFLANEDVKHRRIFSELLNQAGESKPVEGYSGEYMDYLRAYADRHVFNKENTGLQKAKLIKSAKQAIKFAVKIELDSILFYLEAKTLIPKNQWELVDQIIEEERRHYLKLLKIQDEIKRKQSGLV